LVSICKS